jgi:peptidoglycan/xylan/chitin deacetylase (PgdA/CDA1 family)
LGLLDSYGIEATFFVPGITVSRYPEIVQEIRDKGHELGHHGYTHHSPTRLSLDEEKAALEKGLEALDRAAGVKAKGYRSPSWDLSRHSVRLLRHYGFLYDSSLMGDDFRLYALDWDGDGNELVEVPVSWELDDAPHFMFNFSPKYRAGLSSPSKVFEIWASEFEGAYAEEGVFTLTMHPQIMGRYHRLKLLEKLIDLMRSRPGVHFTTCEAAVQDWLENRKPQ